MSGRSPRDVHTPISARQHGTAIEQKCLELYFEIADVSFNYSGHFLLEFVVQSLYNNDLSDIRVKTRHDASWTSGFKFRTGVTGNLAVNEKTTIDPPAVHFYLPKGFCKNDKDHDVYLLVVAFDVDPNTARSRRLGEAKMAIFPREDTFIDHDAEMGEPIYHLSSRLVILRTSEQDRSQLHCGAINYRAALSETPPLDETPPPTPPRPKPRPAPAPAPAPAREPRRQPSPAKPPPRKTPRDNPPRAVADSPLPPHDAHLGVWRLLADEGKEEICIIVHGARCLPPGKERVHPKAFVLAKLKTDEDKNARTRAVTHAFVRPSSDPSWEELLTVDGDKENMDLEVAIIQLADSVTKNLLAEYRLPVQQLLPFQHYHLDMIWPAGSHGSDEGVHLFATVVRKLSYIPAALRDHTFRALEVNLQNVRLPLRDAAGPLIASCTVVSDYVNYEKFYVDSDVLGVHFHPVTFPRPLLAEVDAERHGVPQVSLPGRPTGHPRWGHSFLFCHPKEVATLFTHQAALIFEFFPYIDPSAVAWTQARAVAHCVMLVDEKAYRRLMQTEEGIRVEIPLRGRLAAAHAHPPSVIVHLRLHKDRVLPPIETASAPWQPVVYTEPDGTKVAAPARQPRPEREVGEPRLLTDEQLYAMPLWDPHNVDHRSRWRHHRQQLLVKDGELPPETAMEKVVSEHSYIVPSNPSQPASRPAPVVAQQALPAQTVYVQTSRASRPAGSEDGQLVLVDGQMAELDRYRAAVQKMGHDILALRERIRVVEGENSVLRRDLAAYNDTSKILLDSVELDGLPKPDLISRYVALKQKLTGTVAELATYKEKVQKLQNDLIRKNQKEEEYIRMTRAHTSQQGLLQKLQEKVARVKKLEEACRQQEKVIERMEQLLQKGKKGEKREKRRPNVTIGTSPYPGPLVVSDDPTDADDVNAALMEENRRLRRQLDDWKKETHGDRGDDADRLELYQLLDRAEGRIVSLEQQMSENARKWGREKEDLVNRLREHEFGLASNDYLDEPSLLYGQPPGIPSSHVVLPVIAPVNALRSQLPSPQRQPKINQDSYRAGKHYR